MYRSQFMQQADPAGTIKFFPPMGTGFTVGEKEWLKTGLAKDKTNYSEAAATLATQVVGIYGDKYTSSSSPEIASSASDGNGVIILISANGQVHISTDYGATWASAPTSVVNPSCVYYNGTTWIIVGNSAGNIYVQTSTNPASSWTALQTITYSPGNATLGTASVCWDSVNSKFIIVVAGSSVTDASLNSPTGASGSWTKVNLTTALNSRTSIAAYNGTVIACCWGSGAILKTTNGGTSWSNGVSIGVNASNIVVVGGKFFRIVSTSSIASTTDGTTWTTSTTVPETGFAVGNLQTLVSDGTTLFFNANQAKYIGYSTDGITFTVKSANWTASYGTSIACMGVNKIFCVDNGGASSKTLRSVNVNTCDYVGTSTTFYNIGTTYQNGYLVGYVRIK
jgi:hypothetical protein